MTNYISRDNSSEVPLGIGKDFSGNWEDVGKYTDVVISVTTDQDGYYEVQFSPDGVNVDSTLTRYYRTAYINAPHRFTITRRFFRIRFYNSSGVAQTYFRLQVIVGDGLTALNAPVDGALSKDYDAIVVRPTDPEDEAALGLRQGQRSWQKFGYNPVVDIAATETIWAVGGTYTPPTTARTLDIVSSDAADDDGSTGANNIYIYGIDANRKYAVEAVTMNGTTTVTTTSTWLGINRVAVGLAGTALNNVGNITITQTTDGRVMAYMPATQSVTQQMIYHNQIGWKGLAKDLMLSVRKTSGGQSPRVTLTGWVFSPVSNANYEVFRWNMDTAIENTFILNSQVPFVLNSGDVLQFKASTNQDGTQVSGRFSLTEYRDANETPT